MFPEISQNSQKKHLCQSFRPAKRLWRRCFPENYSTFLTIPFLQSTSVRLLLIIKAINFLKHPFTQPTFEKLITNIMKSTTQYITERNTKEFYVNGFLNTYSYLNTRVHKHKNYNHQIICFVYALSKNCYNEAPSKWLMDKILLILHDITDITDIICILRVYITCIYYMYYMYITCILHVYYILLLHVYYMYYILHITYITCVLHVYDMYIKCNIHAYYMYITCILHVILLILLILYVYSW